MAKDVNIHIKTPGAREAKRQLGDVAKSAAGVGDKTQHAGKKGAEGADQATQKFSGMGRALSKLKTQVTGLISAWLGFQAVIKLIGHFNTRLERTKTLQQEIYQQSLSFAEVGQALEIQTGTKGRQQYWAKLALGLQQAGGLRDPAVAQQMLVSGDIAFAAAGGIKNRQVQDMLMAMSPMVGAAGLGGQDVGKFFEFAGTAGVPLETEAYKKYFAQIMAGYTASKSTSFGGFMTGLQKGGTGYIAQGGSLAEAISLFTGARAVMDNEAVAATLLEQMSRLASGAYARPRQTMEKALGVDWSSMSMDQRTGALLQYVQSIPESQRAQMLASQGFPTELITQISKIVSPEATTAIRSTRGAVAGASVADTDAALDAYMNSRLAKSRQKAAGRSMQDLAAGPGFAAWSERLTDARKRFDILLAKGQDRKTVPDWAEPEIMALESILTDVDSLIETAPPTQLPELTKLREDLAREISLAKKFPNIQVGLGRTQGYGYEYSRALDAVGQAQNITIINDSGQKFYPRVGDDLQGPRFTQD